MLLEDEGLGLKKCSGNAALYLEQIKHHFTVMGIASAYLCLSSFNFTRLLFSRQHCGEIIQKINK